MIKRQLILFMALLILLEISNAQAVPKGLEMQELIRISEMYRLQPDLSFNIKYQSIDSTGAIDSVAVNGEYKIHEGRFWGRLDSTEYIQGYNYKIAVYYSDSLIMINKPDQMHLSVLQADVLDSLFQDNFLDSMTVTAVNDSTNKINVIFKSESPYKSYEVCYNPNNYLIRSIKIKIKPSEDNPDSITNLLISFSNYSMAVIDEDYFRESKYIIKDGNIFHLQSPYQSFELSVNGSF